jgi:hypothetical protein
VLNAVNDWVALREHFEKASAIPDSKRQDIIAACNRRGLDPISPLRSYFVRFIAPQATRPEVVDDFTAFFQTFYLAGGERQHYSSRLIGWLRVVFGCGEVATRAVFQRYYVEKHIPAEFRWQLATEMHQAGLLLPSVYQATPKPTHEPGPEIIDGSIRAELDDEAFQLTGCRRAEGGERALLASVGQRGPWLATIVVIALATLLFYRLFPSKAQRFAELALFVPPLLLLVDAVAQQSVALAIRRYRLGSLRPRNLQRDTGWEVRIGLALGGGCGLALAVLALAWSGASVALCVWLTAFLGTALAAGAGFLVPTAQRRLPSLAWIAAGPSTRAAAAIITLLIYAAIARCLA